MTNKRNTNTVQAKQLEEAKANTSNMKRSASEE